MGIGKIHLVVQLHGPMSVSVHAPCMLIIHVHIHVHAHMCVYIYITCRDGNVSYSRKFSWKRIFTHFANWRPLTKFSSRKWSIVGVVIGFSAIHEFFPRNLTWRQFTKIFSHGGREGGKLPARGGLVLPASGCTCYLHKVYPVFAMPTHCLCSISLF